MVLLAHPAVDRATATQIVGVLEDAYNPSRPTAIGNLLSLVDSDVISILRGAFEDFGDDVADFFDDLF